MRRGRSVLLVLLPLPLHCSQDDTAGSRSQRSGQAGAEDEPAASRASNSRAPVKTKAEFCFVLQDASRLTACSFDSPPRHLTFDLNRHSYSEGESRAGRGFAKYTAVIGVLSMTGDLLGRGAVQTEFGPPRICTTASPAARDLAGPRPSRPWGVKRSASVSRPASTG